MSSEAFHTELPRFCFTSDKSENTSGPVLDWEERWLLSYLCSTSIGSSEIWSSVSGIRKKHNPGTFPSLSSVIDNEMLDVLQMKQEEQNGGWTTRLGFVWWGSTVQKKTAVAVNNTSDCYCRDLCPLGHTADGTWKTWRTTAMADARQKELYGLRKSLQFITNTQSQQLKMVVAPSRWRGACLQQQQLTGDRKPREEQQKPSAASQDSWASVQTEEQRSAQRQQGGCPGVPESKPHL